MMKRFITVFCMIIVLGLVSCDKETTTVTTTELETTTVDQQAQFELAMQNFENIENAQIDITVVMFGMEVSTQVIMDGDMAMTSIDGEVLYSMYIDENYYEYTEYPNGWLAMEASLGIDDTDYSDVSGEGEFYYEDFTFENGYYVYQIEDEDYPGLKFKIEGNYVTEMYMGVEEDGFEMSFTYEFSNYGTAEVDLPGEVIDFETYNQLIAEMISLELDFNFWPEQIDISSDFGLVNCNLDDDFCTLENYPAEAWTFTMDGTNFNYDGTQYTSIDDLYSNSDFEMPQEIFEVILEALDLLYI